MRTTPRVFGAYDRRSPVRLVVFATALLFAASWLISPGSVSPGSLRAMLPFAGILAIAAVGQTVVIQQRGFDLSVPGLMTCAPVVAYFISTHADLPGALNILTALVIVTFVGGLNGWVVAYLNVSSIVATLAMNSVLLGAVLALSGGTTLPSSSLGVSVAQSTILGVPGVFVAAVVVVAGFGLALTMTPLGRRLNGVGANPSAARALGLRPRRYVFGAFAASGFCCGVGGLLLSGYTGTTLLNAGDTYLLPAIAAVVIGGTSLMGGRVYVAGTFVAALFMSQLTQFVLSLGADVSSQLLVQSGALVAAGGVQAARLDPATRFARLMKGRVREPMAATASISRNV